MKMKYSIEFIYSDNNQVYLDDVELELEEFTRVSAFLYALEKAGVIEKEGGGGELIYPFSEPELSSFEDLQKRWSEGSLVSMGADYEIEL
jgi:hypothetical protein